jgi:hypothetical protein
MEDTKECSEALEIDNQKAALWKRFVAALYSMPGNVEPA